MPRKYVRKTVEEKEYWKGIWRRAAENMPVRVYEVYHTEWIPAGSISVALYGQLLARKNIEERGGKEGRFRRVVTCSKGFSYRSPIQLFLILMGDTDRHASDRLHVGTYRGTKPRNPARRARLIALAEHGREIAWDYLTLVGKDHLYSNERSHDEFYNIINPKHLKKYKRRRF